LMSKQAKGVDDVVFVIVEKAGYDIGAAKD
jgi:hypothetical protein